jgi:hypothetical protein
MTRSIYRSEAGRHAIRAWCERRLDAAGMTGRDLDTSLGRTRATTVGDGPDVVLLPGTNFSTATSLELLALVGREHRAIGVDLPGQPGLSAGERPSDRDAYGLGLRELIRWLLRRDEASSAALLGRMADPGADLPVELVTWIALVGRHVRTTGATAPSGSRARRGAVSRLAGDRSPGPVPARQTPS